LDGLFSFLARVSDGIVALAERLGAGGLALVAFLDSSFLSLPQVTDALTVALTLKNPSNWMVHALAATGGSLAGCLALFLAARKGGEAFLRRRFKQGHIDRGLRLFQRHGWLTIAVPAIMPPPTPFKLFVLLAGVAEIRVLTFLAAAAVGRAFRYGGEAWLTYTYGEQATELIAENLPVVSVIVATVVLVAGIALVLWRRKRASA
jgi:membrane protein YqaA with SNARE-associated domain